jgi:hypothetical protein
MGADACRCGPGRRVAYVPSAAIVSRRTALLELGGFDEDLRFGEDVDLCLRLDGAGWVLRYAPELEVEHRPRHTLRAFAAQRFDYGGSAAALDRRHPGRVAPLVVNRHAAAVLGAAVIGSTRSLRTGGAAAALAVAGSTAVTAAKGESAPAAAALASLAIRGHAVSGRQLARAIARDWLPLAAAAAVASGRARRAAGLALAIDALCSLSKSRPASASGRRLALRLLDGGAYSAGLWRGMLHERRIGAALPALRRL